MSEKEEEVLIEVEKPTYCIACGEQLRTFSMLVCADCLDDECHEFIKKASDENG